MTWQRLCSLSELKEGGLAKLALDGVWIMVARAGDRIAAFPPHCPHMAEPLEESGVCDGETLTCTKHVWQWDLRTGEAIGLAEKPLALYPTECRGEDVWIDFDDELTYEHD
ncbi:MAG: Rieske 2Fe-2S domain-containing protein [Rhodospirillales bacterium]|nr:Rieske 2Fe-2S domain-containing protein [Rhodospirillales bacterium]